MSSYQGPLPLPGAPGVVAMTSLVTRVGLLSTVWLFLSFQRDCSGHILKVGLLANYCKNELIMLLGKKKKL